MPGNYSKMKVAELRSKLEELGLETKGLKAVLVKRLEDAESTPAEAPAAVEEEEPAEPPAAEKPAAVEEPAAAEEPAADDGAAAAAAAAAEAKATAAAAAAEAKAAAAAAAADAKAAAEAAAAKAAAEAKAAAAAEAKRQAEADAATKAAAVKEASAYAAAVKEAAAAKAAAAKAAAAKKAEAQAAAVAAAKASAAKLAAETLAATEAEAAALDAEEAAEEAAAKAAKAAKGGKKKKRGKKKKAAHTKAEPEAEEAPAAAAKPSALSALTVNPSKAAAAEVEYVADDTIEVPETEEYEEFKRVFASFAKPDELLPGKDGAKPKKAPAAEEAEGAKGEEKEEKDENKEEEDEDEDDDEKELSKKKKKLMSRMTVAQLKHLVKTPELVETHDANSTDPRLLTHLKSYRNTVPVPRHWSQKRKYLQGKRGIEKAPFQLPDFIEDTGISKIREAYMDKAAEKTAKQKQRERTMGKANKIDIDYQILHDAFFRFQTKPKMSGPGELYYEGKEFEVNVSEKRPGFLSDALSEALAMPEGAPPPWLINMQRYGPPPSYPALQIQGLNAPIPDGAQFGYHPGGWGKPPVDEFGRPLYGDVFGTQAAKVTSGPPPERAPWGELEEEESDSSSEEEEDEGEGMDDETSESGISSVTSIASMSSLASGLETPDAIDLRKDGGAPKLFQVLEQKETRVGSGIMGSSHGYVVPGEGGAEEAASSGKGRAGADLLRKDSNVDVQLDPKDLESDEAMQAALKKKFEDAQAVESAKRSREDLSGMVADEAGRLNKKRKASEKKKEGKQYKNVF